jgi:methylmalonyl-CoA/ethylmalonyl-CoA epimerase
MPAIRHVAIMCQDPPAMADFYKQTFEMHEVARQGRVVYLSDGYLNLALLQAREGVKPGIHHFGFQVEDMDEIRKRLELAEVPAPYQKPGDGRYAEWGGKDPEGNGFDIGVAGWFTQPDEGLAPQRETGPDARA